MTTLEAPVTTDGSVEAAVDRGLPPPPERGTTTIVPRVFERLATHAAAQVPGVAGVVQTGATRFLPWVDGSPAAADAEVDNDDVVLDLTLNVAYPQPVRQVTEQVRSHVAAQVGSQTGRRVQEINITVPDLVVRKQHRPRVR